MGLWRQDLEVFPLVYHWSEAEAYLSTDHWEPDEMERMVKLYGPPDRVCFSSRLWEWFDQAPASVASVWTVSSVGRAPDF